jgi:hypothetical protein
LLLEYESQFQNSLDLIGSLAMVNAHEFSTTPAKAHPPSLAVTRRSLLSISMYCTFFLGKKRKIFFIEHWALTEYSTSQWYGLMGDYKNIANSSQLVGGFNRRSNPLLLQTYLPPLI